MLSSSSSVLNTAFLEPQVVVLRVSMQWLLTEAVFVMLVRSERHLLHCVTEPSCCLECQYIGTLARIVERCSPSVHHPSNNCP